VEQEPNIEKLMGTIVPFEKVKVLNKVRNSLPKYLAGDKSKDLVCEGNYYYDLKMCGVGWHGDAERKKVVGLRLGSTMPLHYNWFQNAKPIGKTIKLSLDGGDLYVMSEKASGHDWKNKKKITLRHAAGAEKFLMLN
jgi:hypothetical protein